MECINGYLVCLYGFFCPAIPKVISQQVLVTVRTHDDIYSAAPVREQAVSTLIQYPTQSRYPDTVVTSPCPILLLLIQKARLGSKNLKYQFCKSLV